MEKEHNNTNFSKSLKDWIREDRNIWKWEEQVKICHGFEDWLIKFLSPLFQAMHYCFRNKRYYIDLSSVEVHAGFFKRIQVLPRAACLNIGEVKKKVRFLRDIVFGLCIHRKKEIPEGMSKKVGNVLLLRIVNNFIRMCKSVEESNSIDKALYYALFVSENPIVFDKTKRIIFALKAWNIRKMDKNAFDQSLVPEEYKTFMTQPIANIDAIHDIANFRKNPDGSFYYTESGRSVVLYWNIQRHAQDLMFYVEENLKPKNTYRNFTVALLHDMACAVLVDMVPFLWYDLAHKFESANVYGTGRTYRQILDDEPLLYGL